MKGPKRRKSSPHGPGRDPGPARGQNDALGPKMTDFEAPKSHQNDIRNSKCTNKLLKTYPDKDPSPKGTSNFANLFWGTLFISGSLLEGLRDRFKDSISHQNDFGNSKST